MKMVKSTVVSDQQRAHRRPCVGTLLQGQQAYQRKLSDDHARQRELCERSPELATRIEGFWVLVI